jgi:anhydro-N-acetylmuramic acid kinase
VQNIGGIANVTYLPPGGRAEDVIAFDTGPGNMVIDALARRLAGVDFDEGGRRAAEGQVDEELLNELMRHPFLQTPPPRSTGREQFGDAFVERLSARCRRLGLTTASTLATATAFTARSIAGSYFDYLMPNGPVDEVVLSGGGAHNETLVAMLSQYLRGRVPVIRSDQLGLPVDFKEALAFAVLASEAACGRPANLPAASGASGPRVLGSLTTP